MAFLEQLAAVTERIRRGETPPLDELMELKRENRRHAEAAEREDRAVCDSLPTWINTTNSTVCNLKCFFCNQAYGKGVDIKMEERVYQKVVEELYPAAETVQLSAYGEPMMTPHIRDKFADMDRFGVKCEMMTNASLMKGDALLERMARIMGNLRISIDGAKAETFNNIRVGGDFDEIFKNIRRYNHFRHQLPEAERAPLHFSYILMKKTVDELPDFVRLVSELDTDTVWVTHLVLFEEGVRDQLLSDDPEWRKRTNEAMLKAQELAQELGQNLVLPAPFVEEEPTAGTEALVRPDPIRCYFLWQRMYVGPTGDVVPCCLAGIHSNGNVAESSFAEQWNSELYQDMRRRVHSDDPYKPCATCYLVHRAPEGAEYDFTDA
ncbi:MAG: radical SAM protein [Planctomycetota bacterium]